MILFPMGIFLLVLGLILLVAVNLLLGLVVLAAGLALALAAMPFAGWGPWGPHHAHDEVVVRRWRPYRPVRRTTTHVVEDDVAGPPAGPPL
jgi:hypothetical protein